MAIMNCKDPSKADDFNYWYNHIHLPDVTALGIFQHAIRFANSDLNSPAGQYVSIFETTLEDVSKAMPAHREARAKLGDKGYRGTSLGQDVFTAVFKRLGGEFAASRRPTLGILLVLSDCKDTADEDEFNRWYEDVHIPDILDTGAFHTAYRYQSLDLQATKAKYLAIYETDNTDPAKARDELGKVRADWQQRGRLFDGIEVVSSLTARRIWPMD